MNSLGRPNRGLTLDILTVHILGNVDKSYSSMCNQKSWEMNGQYNLGDINPSLQEALLLHKNANVEKLCILNKMKMNAKRKKLNLKGSQGLC